MPKPLPHRACLRLAVAALCLAGLGACDKVGDPIEAIGARRPPPDEFQVIARKPIVVPEGVAGAELPRPDPGRPSPLEPDPNRDAVAALLGAGRSAPAVQAQSVSEGERVLLQSANAAAASSSIRTQLDEDRAAAERAEAEGPYEPPTLLELFGGEEEDPVDPEIVLDPIAESQRLQREGIAAPNDPLAVAETDEGPREEDTGFYRTLDRRPQNRLNEPTPAFPPN